MQITIIIPCCNSVVILPFEQRKICEKRDLVRLENEQEKVEAPLKNRFFFRRKPTATAISKLTACNLLSAAACSSTILISDMETYYCFLPLPLLHRHHLLFPCVSAAAQDDSRYVNCRKPFKCGHIEAEYSFWGGNRAEYCGRPGFKLECESDETTITPASEKFRILELDQVKRTMRVAREDLLENTCLPQFPHTDINISTFRFAPGIRNLTLYYNCSYSLQPTSILDELDCSVNGENVKLFLPVPVGGPTRTCRNNFTILIPKAIYSRLRRIIVHLLML